MATRTALPVVLDEDALGKLLRRLSDAGRSDTQIVAEALTFEFDEALTVDLLAEALTTRVRMIRNSHRGASQGKGRFKTTVKPPRSGKTTVTRRVRGKPSQRDALSVTYYAITRSAQVELRYFTAVDARYQAEAGRKRASGQLAVAELFEGMAETLERFGAPTVEDLPAREVTRLKRLWQGALKEE